MLLSQFLKEKLNNCYKGTSCESICLSGMIHTGNFCNNGSLIAPSVVKHELMLQTKHSSSRFITAPSPWMVIPTTRLRASSGSCSNIGCEFHPSNCFTCLQKEVRSLSLKFPRSRDSKAKLDCISAIEWMISCGASTLIGTFWTLVESICSFTFRVYGCSWNPNTHRNHLWRSRSEFWACLPPHPNDPKAWIAAWGISWSCTIPWAISHAEVTPSFPLPMRSVSLSTVVDSSKSSNRWRFLPKMILETHSCYLIGNCDKHDQHVDCIRLTRLMSRWNMMEQKTMVMNKCWEHLGTTAIVVFAKNWCIFERVDHFSAKETGSKIQR